MKRNVLLVVFAGLALSTLGQTPVLPPPSGTISGSVTTLKGGKPHGMDVWVYLEGGRSQLHSWTVKITQQTQQFRPRVVVVPRGATVTFPNADSFDHNVFSPSKGRSWLGFDLGRYGKTPVNKPGPSKRFLEVGEFDIYCDIHSNMSAIVKVVPLTYFTKVQNGKYTLTNVPPGTYKVWAWSPEANRLSSGGTITVAANGTVALPNIRVQWTGRAQGHMRKDGTPYPITYP